MPATLEERVAYLEGKVEEHSEVWRDIKDHIIHMEQKFEQRFISLEQRINNFEEKVDRRFEAIDRRFEGIDRRIDALDQKFSRYFLWIIGVQVTIFLAIIATLLK